MTLLFAPPLDLGIPGMSLYLGLCGVGALVLLAMVIGLEAIIFHRMLPGGKALRDSAIVNIASTLLGIPFALIVIGSVSGKGSQWVYPFLVAAWALSVAVEAGILRLLESDIGWRTILPVSLVANLLSYLLLFAAIWALVRFT